MIANVDNVDHPSQLVGQKVALLCARYTYRGVLSKMADDFYLLVDATSVESGGRSMSEKPIREDPIGGSAWIKADAVELVFQPEWCRAPLPNEEGWTPTSDQ